MKRVLFLFLVVITHVSYSQEREWCYHSTINVNDPKVGQYLQLVISYDFDHSGAESTFVLDSAAALVGKLGKFIFAIESHTDCRSDSLYNFLLTKRRADSICAYMHRVQLLQNLICMAKGESEPVSDCRCERRIVSRVCTEEEYQLDRRTILRIIAKMP